MFIFASFANNTHLSSSKYNLVKTQIPSPSTLKSTSYFSPELSSHTGTQATVEIMVILSDEYGNEQTAKKST